MVEGRHQISGGFGEGAIEVEYDEGGGSGHESGPGREGFSVTVCLA
jgi:hypothetical protein